MPTQFLIVIVVYVIMHFVLRYTMFGRGLYAIGSDSVAAERAGLKVGRIRFFAYVLGVVLATLVLQMVSTLMNMFSGLSAFYRDVIWGALLIIMLIVNHTLDARRAAAR